MVVSISMKAINIAKSFEVKVNSIREVYAT
jgi:hypothetical protein